MMSMVGTSTSFPLSTYQWKYDVFLSFRGDDTRKGFTDHLYTALERHGIITFKDDPELQKGKPISPELFSAIHESRFGLIVLSENYASSTWCLDELSQIIECMEARETVLPIFYDVNPSDVRKQTASFAEAFTKHKEKLKDDPEKVQRWRNALTKIANFSGWDSKDWYESKLIQNIVEVVWKKLRPSIPSHMEELVGIDSRLNTILKLFSDTRLDDVCFIGIWGMGGIGKTTIARVAYDRISHEFEFKLFLADVRDTADKSGLLPLQKKLLATIGMEKNDIGDVCEGVTMIRRFLHNKKVLLILDDVNHLKQLESLAGNREWFGFGSRVVITTRYERLLIKHEVEKRFEVNGLDDYEALKLFSLKAFKKDEPEQSYVGLCNRVVAYSKGLPLALKVLGSFLFGREMRAWNSALDKLKEVCNSDIVETLKISYDGLEYDERKIFLDIACFFIGDWKARAIETLDACGFYADIGIDVLVEKSLITVDSLGYLSMHDLLQEMGWEIVRRESPYDPGRRSRLWLTKDISNVLMNQNAGSEKIEALAMEADKLGQVQDKQGAVHANAKSFLLMNNLRFLQLNNVDLPNGLEYLPNNLRILKWTGYPLKSFPSGFDIPDKLVHLWMWRSHMEHFSTGIKPLYNLKIMNLSHSLNLVETPDLRGVPFLERLILNGCVQLRKLDPSVVVLERLNMIKLRGCKNLVSLPDNVSTGLKSLKRLDASRCPKLEKLPKDLGLLESLEYLDVSETALIEPAVANSSISISKSLELLSKPNSNPNPNLTAKLWWPCLRQLNLRDCNLLDGAIPDDLSFLRSLEYLYLSRNKFVSLPNSINQLSRLYHLDLKSCWRLRALPELPSTINYVEAFDCMSLKKSGLGYAGKVLANHLKLQLQKKQGFSSTSSSDAEITGSEFQLLLPGMEIPRWLTDKSASQFSTKETLELEPGWLTDECLGFALSAVLEVKSNPLMHKSLELIYFEMSVNKKQLKKWKPLVVSLPGVVSMAADHLLLWFLPLHLKCFVDEFHRDVHTGIELSFSVTSDSLKVIKCGIRLVYAGDVEAV